MNKTGAFRFRATKIGDDTTLSQIIALMEEASASKAPISKLADKVAGIFVPVVISIAILATVVWLLLGQTFSFRFVHRHRGTGHLLPLRAWPGYSCSHHGRYWQGRGKRHPDQICRSAGNGPYGQHCRSGQNRHDYGRSSKKLPGFYPASGVTEEKLLQIAASLESLSEHPLAQAIVSLAKQRDLSLLDPCDFQALSGLGLSASLEGIPYFAGNERLMEERGAHLMNCAPPLPSWRRKAKRRCILHRTKRCWGLFRYRMWQPTSAQAIEEMKQLGLEGVMFTGDNQKTADAIGRQLGVLRLSRRCCPRIKSKNPPAAGERQKSRHGRRRHQRCACSGPCRRRHRHRRRNRHRVGGSGYRTDENDLLDAVTAIHLEPCGDPQRKRKPVLGLFYTIALAFPSRLAFSIPCGDGSWILCSPLQP